jgi:hypothetical protein
MIFQPWIFGRYFLKNDWNDLSTLKKATDSICCQLIKYGFQTKIRIFKDLPANVSWKNVTCIFTMNRVDIWETAQFSKPLFSKLLLSDTYWILDPKHLKYEYFKIQSFLSAEMALKSFRFQSTSDLLVRDVPKFQNSIKSGRLLVPSILDKGYSTCIVKLFKVQDSPVDFNSCITKS